MSRTSKTLMHVAIVAMFLATALPVSDASTAPVTNCSGTGCMVGKDAPVDMKVWVCDGPSNPISTFDNKMLTQGSTSCSDASFWVLASGSQVYGPGALRSSPNQYHKYRDPAGEYIVQYFELRKQGEEVDLMVNYTLVNNGTLIHYSAHNHGNAPWELGFKYSWDLHLDRETDPAICVQGRAQADGASGKVAGQHSAAGGCYAYHGQEVEFGPTSHDINFVKSWQTISGPDGDDDLKAWYWWDPAYGGTPPDFIQYMDSGRAIGSSNSLYYSLNSGAISESEFQPYFGYPDLIQLAADDGKPGGDDEWDAFIWFATGPVDPLISYGISGSFANRDPTATASTAFVNAGETVSFPIQVTSTTGMGRDGKGRVDQRVEYSIDAVSIPDNWAVELVDAVTLQPASEDVLWTDETRDLKLLVTAPEDAYGNDAARINVRATLPGRPGGAYNKEGSNFDMTLSTVTLVRPDYGIKISSGNDVPVVRPGESVEFEVDVTNTGNLQGAYGVLMDIPSGLGLGWGKHLEPGAFDLERGETRSVKLRLDIPEDEFGGERTVTVRSSVIDQNEFNTTLVKFRILSDALVDIVPAVEEIILAPGGETAFDASITNLGFEDVDLNFHAKADAVSTIGGGSVWEVAVDASSLEGPLPPGVTEDVRITVRAPENAGSGEQTNVLLFATREGGTADLDKELVRAVVGRATNIEVVPLVDSLAGNPGDALRYEVLVRNVGNAIEDLTLEFTEEPAGWDHTIHPADFELEPGQERTVVVEVFSNPQARAGNHHRLAVDVRNTDLTRSQELPLMVRINQIFHASIDTETPVVRMLPEDVADVLFEIKNLGNGEDRFTLSGIPAGWDVVLEPAITPTLQPGETALVHMKGKVSGQLGTFVAQIEPVSDVLGEPASEEAFPLTMVVSRPDLAIKAVRVESPARHLGDLETIVAEIENRGGIEADQVDVQLLVDGVETARVSFERLSPNDRTLVASLSWARTAGAQVYEIVIDPDNIHDEGDGERNNVEILAVEGEFKADRDMFDTLSGASDRMAPGASPLWLVGALMGLLVVLRRRN